LGKGVIPAQERFDPEKTFNPTYELQYWYWALNVAQQWRKRTGMSADMRYTEVMNKLSKLPEADGVYLATESAPDSYTNPKFKTDHPSVMGALGMVPYNQRLDMAVMKKTFDLVWNTWDWKDTWGWDFPMVAMTAARLNDPKRAIDALFMNIKTNTYLVNGHNYQDDRLTIYLPGNGGLLAAVAMMCAGWNGSKGSNPGFPHDGTWKVKWEGLEKAP
jgi:protein-glucosylgalactosylhydroxylysine glucosidase